MSSKLSCTNSIIHFIDNKAIANYCKSIDKQEIGLFFIILIQITFGILSRSYPFGHHNTNLIKAV